MVSAKGSGDSSAGPGRDDHLLMPMLHFSAPKPALASPLLAGLLAATALAAACSVDEEAPVLTLAGTEATLQITSPSFTDGSTIPVRHTCEGDDVSPALEWSGLPAGVKSLALIVDDPDAPGGDWVHWVAYDLPADLRGVPEIEAGADVAVGSVDGVNDFGRRGYRGPCPPPGAPHRYFFKLYALDTLLGLEPGAKKSDMIRAMQGHTLGTGELMGTFGR